MRETPTPDGTEPALAMRDVSVSFLAVRALDGVTAVVPTGGITAVIGPNGAGKTTLLNCISGLYRHQGEIELHGRSLTGLPTHRRHGRDLARTFQTPALLDELPAIDNVMLGANAVLRGWTAGRGGKRREREAHDRAAALLERVGIAPASVRPVGDLPHGERRRIEVARALVTQPRVLLLDEPAAGLDDDEAADLLTVASEAGSTCVLVEHNMRLVMAVARHVVVLAAGRVLASGTPEEISRDPRVLEAYLGDGAAA
ncbi:MAG TPA: ABC transporter ATP-binding protein [Micromonosporaceae bacterium]|nr:ABC transporter ATP-binding protein [Micromonosporaceae bacterium]